jgi:hypothetical protein
MGRRRNVAISVALQIIDSGAAGPIVDRRQVTLGRRCSHAHVRVDAWSLGRTGPVGHRRCSFGERLLCPPRAGAARGVCPRRLGSRSLDRVIVGPALRLKPADGGVQSLPVGPGERPARVRAPVRSMTVRLAGCCYRRPSCNVTLQLVQSVFACSGIDGGCRACGAWAREEWIGLEGLLQAREGQGGSTTSPPPPWAPTVPAPSGPRHGGSCRREPAPRCGQPRCRPGCQEGAST